MNSGRALLAFVVCVSAAGSMRCDRSARRVVPQGPEDVWLSRIGTGPSQTARVCSHGAKDRVASVLCDKSAPPIRSLDDLYRALRLGRPGQRLVAATVNSLGLSARTVSSLNPRVLVFDDTSHLTEPINYERFVAAGFTRGEQMVELVGLDPSTYEYTFYLLRFEQACNRSRCTPEDLLTEKIESGWTSWTLYADRDLEDTPLDCLSCHLPFGKGTHKMLLMHQVIDPWMHWSDFRGGDERTLCPIQPPDGSPGKRVVTAEGLDILRAIEGAAGRFAGVPAPELQAAESGKVLAKFLVDAEQSIRVSPYPPGYPYEQLSFQTRETVCERFSTGTSPTWDRQRRESLARGLPIPFYRPDVFEPSRRAEVAGDRAGFLRRHASDDAAEVAASFIGPEIATEIGFLPRERDSAPEILRSMCVRCHATSTDVRFKRARFNAEAIETDRVAPPTFLAIKRRLSLPKRSPDVMPPWRVGELPAWAIARIERYLRDRCTEPGACE